MVPATVPTAVNSTVDADAAVQLQLVREIHRAHPAAAQQLEHAVMAKGRTNH